FADRPSKVHLRDTGCDSRFAQQLPQNPIFASKCGLFHRRPWSESAADGKFQSGIVLKRLFPAFIPLSHSSDSKLRRSAAVEARKMFGFLAPAGCDISYRS